MEKRKHRRIRFERPVTLRLFTGRRETLQAVDLSTNGICLYSEQPRLQNEVIALQFDIQLKGALKHVDVLGKIKHIQLSTAGYNLGVEFV